MNFCSWRFSKNSLCSEKQTSEKFFWSSILRDTVSALFTFRRDCIMCTQTIVIASLLTSQCSSLQKWCNNSKVFEQIKYVEYQFLCPQNFQSVNWNLLPFTAKKFFHIKILKSCFCKVGNNEIILKPILK